MSLGDISEFYIISLTANTSESMIFTTIVGLLGKVQPPATIDTVTVNSEGQVV